MKRLASVLLTLALLLGLATPAAAAKAKAVTMRLQLAEGSVAVRDAAGVPVGYSKGMRLYSGYSVSTGSDSSAYILLDDAKAVKLDRNTSVVIKKSGRKLQVKLKAGQLIFNVTAPLESGENLEIRTSSMVVGIRGSSGVVTLREAIFVTGHGVVYSGNKAYPISGGQGFRPKTGVFQAGVSALPSLYLKEVRDDKLLRSHIQAEGIYSADELIGAIPAAEQREEDALNEGRKSLVRPPADEVFPAFGQGSEDPEPTAYTITWLDDEGNVIDRESLAYGETPEHDAPAKADTATASYAFVGWDPQIAAVTGDASYTAVFEATYDFAAIIPQGTDNAPYQIFFPTEGNTPVTKAREGETFTFYLGGSDGGVSFRVLLNGTVLDGDHVYYSKELDAVVCTFTVPKDPIIEIEAIK